LIGNNISGVLFHDAGNTSYSSLGNMSFRVSQKNKQDFDYLVLAVGFGIRFRTPVGPLRVDLGYGINPPSFFGIPAPASSTSASSRAWATSIISSRSDKRFDWPLAGGLLTKYTVSNTVSYFETAAP
jgi:hypothetical protein